VTEKACRECRLLTAESSCPNCKGTSFSEDWTGIAVIISPDGSQIAEKLKVERPGRYALKVR